MLSPLEFVEEELEEFEGEEIIDMKFLYEIFIYLFHHLL
jgi:hypothetical protein